MLHSLSPALELFIASTVAEVDPASRFRMIWSQEPDDWQTEFMSSTSDIVTVLASRQIGKSQTAATVLERCLARGKFAICVAPALRQAQEIGRKVLFAHQRNPHAPAIIRSTQTSLETIGGGRLEIIPASNETARGYSCDVLCFEESAFIPDEVTNALLPALADDGTLIAITTPGGSKDCFFYNLWSHGDAHRILARATAIPRMAKRVEFLRRTLPDIRFRVEVELEWLGSGAQWIAQHVIENAVTEEVSCLRI